MTWDGQDGTEVQPPGLWGLQAMKSVRSPSVGGSWTGYFAPAGHGDWMIGGLEPEAWGGGITNAALVVMGF